jgi:hypothetical protein
VAASKPPLKHRLEQRITASDSTESLIRFCKKIDRDTGNSGKINRRNSQNYPATSDNSGFFTDDSLAHNPLKCKRFGVEIRRSLNNSSRGGKASLLIHVRLHSGLRHQDRAIMPKARSGP